MVRATSGLHVRFNLLQVSTSPPIDPNLFGADEATDDDRAESSGPQVLLRAVTTPPAPPWDQSRAADMEARLQAPLPAEVVSWRMRRSEAWRPGQPGRYIVAYVRRSDVGEGFSTLETFEGRSYPFEFLPPGQREATIRRFTLAAAGAGAVTLVATFAVVAAIQARGEAEVRLNSVELTVARRQAQAVSQAELARRDQTLAGAGLDAQRPARALSDLAWVAQNRSEGVGIEAALWEPGLTAVEVRGDQQPFTAVDRMLRRAARPVRPGVSLWGISSLGTVPQEPAQ